MSSLLEETLARIEGVVPRARTLAIVNRDHLPLATPQLFSDLLSHLTADLLVLRASGLDWSDWGTVDAIERTLTSLGRTPPCREAAAPFAATA